MKIIFTRSVLIFSTFSFVLSDSAIRISITGWKSRTDISYKTSPWKSPNSLPLLQGSSNNVYVVPSSVGQLLLSCNASHPVEWEFNRGQWDSLTERDVTMSDTRKLADPGPPMKRWYISQIDLIGGSNLLTGNYTCQKLGQPNISTSVYIFWQVESPRQFTLGALAENKPRRLRIAAKENEESFITNIVIPCKVTDPIVPVFLYKITDSSESVVVNNDKSHFQNFQYNPTIGFTLRNEPNPFGTYKCVVGSFESSQEVLFFEVLRQTELNPRTGNFVDKTATFDYDTYSQSFTCCSNSSKSLRMILQPCNHPTSCKMARRKLELMDWSDSEIQPRTNKRCLNLRVPTSNEIITDLGGVVRCTGDDINEIKQYFFPFVYKQTYYTNTSLVPYFNWEDAKESDLKKLTEIKGSNVAPGNLSISCAVSPYYFSKQMGWVTKYYDKIISLNNTGSQNETEFAYSIVNNGHESILNIELQDGHQWLVCLAAVRNSNVTAKKVQLIFNSGALFSSYSTTTQTMALSLHDKNKVLYCEFLAAGGRTEIQWAKNGLNISKDGYNITRNDTSTSLTIALVEKDTEGTYTCKVSNRAGSWDYTFTVSVSDVNVAAVVVFVILGLCLVSGGIFLVWKKLVVKK